MQVRADLHYFGSACKSQGVMGVQEDRDEEATKYFNETLAPEMQILPGAVARRATVDQDIDIGKVAFVDIGWKPKSMRFINSWLHDGLAGTGPQRSSPTANSIWTFRLIC